MPVLLLREEISFTQGAVEQFVLTPLLSTALDGLLKSYMRLSNFKDYIFRHNGQQSWINRNHYIFTQMEPLPIVEVQVGIQPSKFNITGKYFQHHLI